MTSASGNEALDKGHAIRQRLSKAIQHSIGTVELGKFVRFHYVAHLDLTNFRKNSQNVRYIEV